MILDTYWGAVDELYGRIRAQRETLVAAGKLIAEAAYGGNCVHIHDSGHIIDAELISRGGGLILYKQFKYSLNLINPVRKRDKPGTGAPAGGLAEEGLAAYALRASGALPGDVFILGSVSGRTASVVDLAYEAKRMGMKLIVITSMEYSRSVDAVHSCGKKLYEMADIVIDNCAPAAEAMLEVDGLEARLCAASGLSSAYIMWSVTTVVVEELLKRGKVPGVYKSANFPGGTDYNRAVIEPRYADEGI